MIKDWIDYAFEIIIGALVVAVFYCLYMIITAPDFITKQLPDGRTVVCTNTMHQECDWENAR
jgi:hypothetical protein